MLSIITVTYNNFEELVETLNSVPDSEQIEQVVINGGTCPKTLEYLRKNSDLIISVSEKDEGISDAFNKGYEKANGDFITYLNSGDVLTDNSYYLKAIKLFERDPELDYIYADIIFDHREHGHLQVRPNREIYKTPFPHPSLIVRKNVFAQIGGGFNLKLKVAMDYDFMIRMIKANLKGYYYQDYPVVLMDGAGLSSLNGLPGLSERRTVLNKNNLMSHKARLYFNALWFKIKVRKILNTLHISKTYDRAKKVFFPVKPE